MNQIVFNSKLNSKKNQFITSTNSRNLYLYRVSTPEVNEPKPFKLPCHTPRIQGLWNSSHPDFLKCLTHPRPPPPHTTIWNSSSSPGQDCNVIITIRDQTNSSLMHFKQPEHGKVLSVLLKTIKLTRTIFHKCVAHHHITSILYKL